MTVIAFDRGAENQPHKAQSVICLKCLERWVAVFPSKTRLADLECSCGEVGFVIRTGEEIE